ncbi:exonuclease SbcCD subunit D C-terminal domain-containing protein [Vibrio sp. SS-MA-C1-2]|uniref:exonuclease SbcCD subunit D C-terminal domain-containing protein n=1 Tax=Vibrio sp. SS-MA-C1-2 TaxID=2908646 RepID=UPI001F267166|nr:exonuclease SbcCD subunit D C-terminal domain-containing protein [Vibrio sp. SS-MA-C1-2]UJF18991.1 exonuclease SbcCD subunit D C-terminal domain-containing protein [Vibrio sp. SS-MA-C1-2]
MKIIHTSDWHLGHQLHGFSREYEHQCFLDKLIELLKQHQSDALLVAGDIFDSANPPASAWQMLYRFLARLAKELPKLNVVMIGGNHDSPSKLDAPHELLKAFDLHVIGGINRDNEGELDFSRYLIPLTNKDDQVAAWVAAVPFLRSADLRNEELTSDQDRLIAGVDRLYQQVIDYGQTIAKPDQALIGMGHLYMASSQLSEMSERRILGGNQHALPASIFPDCLSYVALGHLHLPQVVAKQDRIRYCGSPIPLSLAERNYKHQVLAVELKENQLLKIEPILLDRVVDLLKVPTKAAPLDEVLQQLNELTLPELPLHQQPFLEVAILLDQPQTLIREKIQKALEGKSVRLAKITTHYQRQEAVTFSAKQLSEVSPSDVFSYAWQQKFEGDISPELSQAFAEIESQVQQQDEEKS